MLLIPKTLIIFQCVVFMCILKEDIYAGRQSIIRVVTLHSRVLKITANEEINKIKLLWKYRRIW